MLYQAIGTERKGKESSVRSARMHVIWACARRGTARRGAHECVSERQAARETVVDL
jgi:hypothetical protein